jgi:hypothetical protein
VSVIGFGIVVTPGPYKIYLVPNPALHRPSGEHDDRPGRRPISLFLMRNPLGLAVQRWLMGTALAGLAVNMAVEARR